MQGTIPGLLAHWVRSQPQTTAISIEGSGVGYQALSLWVDRVARTFEAMGISPGDRVCFCADNSLAYWASVLGVVRIGAIAAPLHVSFTPSELSDRIKEYAPNLIVVDERQAPKFAVSGAPLLKLDTLNELREGPELTPTSAPHADQPAMIVMTSGSTSRPKGVVLTHRSIVNYAVFWALQEPGYRCGARVLGSGVASTAAGFVKTPQYLLSGATFFFETRFDPERFIDQLVREKITTFGGVPFFYEQMARSPSFAAADFSALTLATVSGGVMANAAKKAWADKGVPIRQGYGQTECGGIITLAPAHLASAAPEKCGAGSAVADIRVMDEGGALCAPGASGEIEVRSVAAMRGYWNDAHATDQVRRGDWIRTGDVGVLDEAGHLTFVARLKDIIVSGGMKIAAAEVEAAIAAIEGVEEVAVIGVPDPTYGETPLAVVYGQSPVDADLVKRRCREVLAGYKLPRYLVQTPAPLPRLAMGKFDKGALRRAYATPEQLPKPIR